METSSVSPVKARKLIGVRATDDQRRVLSEAAKREHQSVSSFVLQAALQAASTGTLVVRTPESVQQAIDRAQALMKGAVPRDRLLVEEWLLEKREAAARE